MKRIINKENTDAVSSTWPYGKIRDDSGANDGTPVNADVYQDHHQFFEKLMVDNLETPNGQLDNSVNGFQLNDALTRQIFGANLITNACISQPSYNINQGELVASGVAVIYGEAVVFAQSGDNYLEIRQARTVFVVYEKNVYLLYQHTNTNIEISPNQTLYVLKDRGVFGLQMLSFVELPNSEPIEIGSWVLDTYERPFIRTRTVTEINTYIDNARARVILNTKTQECGFDITFAMGLPLVGNNNNELLLAFAKDTLPVEIVNIIDSAITLNGGFVSFQSGAGFYHPFNFEIRSGITGYDLYKHDDANNYSVINGTVTIKLNIRLPIWT